MKFIDLSKGLQAIVDDEDFECISQFSWYASGRITLPYAARTERVPGQRAMNRKHIIYMHRVLLKVSPEMFVDHINFNTLDNRKSNLRIVTKKENQRHQRARPRDHTKFKGVDRHKHSNTWFARIVVNGKTLRVSNNFRTDVEAALEYDRLAILHYGNYAVTNRDLGLLENIEEGLK